MSAEGLEETVQVYLANPPEAKNRKGHQTGKKDSWWLAHLLRHAMIRPSLVPPRGLRELRDFTRRRRKLIGIAAGEKNRAIGGDATPKHRRDEIESTYGLSSEVT